MHDLILVNLYFMTLTHTANYEGCHIQVNSNDTVGRPTFEGVFKTTYSCVNSTAARNCDYDVHVLSAFCGNGDIINWNTVLGTGSTIVNINADAIGSNRSLVLVLLSHYPSYWTLNVPSGLTIAKVLLVSKLAFSLSLSLTHSIHALIHLQHIHSF